VQTPFIATCLLREKAPSLAELSAKHACALYPGAVIVFLDGGRVGKEATEATVAPGR